jgi:hypothetical protein
MHELRQCCSYVSIAASSCELCQCSRCSGRCHTGAIAAAAVTEDFSWLASALCTVAHDALTKVYFHAVFEL